MIAVLVSLDGDDFGFDLALLVPRSIYFQKALADRKESRYRDQIVLKFPDLSPQYFKMYWYWVYELRLDYEALGYCSNEYPPFVDLSMNPLAGDDPGVARERQTKQAEILADNLKQLWALGGFLEDVDFQDAVSNEFARWYIDKQVPSSISEPTFALVEKHTGRRIEVPLPSTTTVLVGEMQTPFTVNPRSLLQESLFFRQVLGLENDPKHAEPTAEPPVIKFKHGDKVVVYLPEIQELNFKLYAAWINDAQLDFHQLQPHLAEEATNTSPNVLEPLPKPGYRTDHRGRVQPSGRSVHGISPKSHVLLDRYRLPRRLQAPGQDNV
jgi:hypothetical protein